MKEKTIKYIENVEAKNVNDEILEKIDELSEALNIEYNKLYTSIRKDCTRQLLYSELSPINFCKIALEEIIRRPSVGTYVLIFLANPTLTFFELEKLTGLDARLYHRLLSSVASRQKDLRLILSAKNELNSAIYDKRSRDPIDEPVIEAKDLRKTLQNLSEGKIKNHPKPPKTFPYRQEELFFPEA